MKDAIGQEIKVGDLVAISYHPEAYSFSVEAATIKSFTGTKNKMTTELLHMDAKAAYMPDETGEVYRRVVKVSPDFPTLTDVPLDAVGHAIHPGDTIAVRLPVEGAGNTQKGFVKGGKVVRITDKTVFYEEVDTGETKRKAFNGVVVV